MDGALFLREIGVVASSARSYEAPVLIFKGAEQFVREEALVVIDDAKFSRRFLGVLRYVTKLDPLLNPKALPFRAGMKYERLFKISHFNYSLMMS